MCQHNGGLQQPNGVCIELETTAKPEVTETGSQSQVEACYWLVAGVVSAFDHLIT